MAWWRSLKELRQAFADSGISLGRPAPPELRSCRGKIRHATRADAEQHLRTLLAYDDGLYRRRHRKGPLGIYRCHGCQFFHVGHSSQGRRVA